MVSDAPPVLIRRLEEILLFHSYKKFLVFTECTLYIVFNFVQMENL